MQPNVRPRWQPTLPWVVIALVLAPVGVASLMAVTTAVPGPAKDAFGSIREPAFVWTLFAAYPCEFLVVIPACLFLRRREFTPIPCILIGAIAAGLPFLILRLVETLYSVFQLMSYGNHLASYGNADRWWRTLVTMAEVSPYGAFGGLLFWLIAMTGSWPPPKPATR